MRGYKEEGTTTTPLDMVVLNELDRFHLTQDAIDRAPQLQFIGAYAKQLLHDKLIDHRQYVTQRGENMSEIWDWKWTY